MKILNLIWTLNSHSPNCPLTDLACATRHIVHIYPIVVLNNRKERKMLNLNTIRLPSSLPHNCCSEKYFFSVYVCCPIAANSINLKLFQSEKTYQCYKFETIATSSMILFCSDFSFFPPLIELTGEREFKVKKNILWSFTHNWVFLMLSQHLKFHSKEITF